MKRSKNTKRALLLSTLSMLLCLSMLVGSTFAWFTDSVTSGRNKIVAGNLDIELYEKNGSGYTPVTADTNLFHPGALWEPGHVEVINLKIENLGTLALKYRLGINIVREKGGTNVEGNDFQLSDYIQFALIEGEQTYANREDAVRAAEAASPKKLSHLVGDDSLSYPGFLYSTGETHCVTLVVYMPTTVGNEANYKTGTKVPEIELGVTLLATQTPYEEDSFDNQYDVNADFAVASIRGKLYPSLKSAFADAEDGDTIYLLRDATTAQIYFAPKTSKKVTVDMCGYSINTVQNDNKQTWFMMVYKPSKTSTAVADVTFENGRINCYDNGFWVEDGAKLTLDNVKLNVQGAYSVPKEGKATYAIYLTKYANTEGVTVLLKDSEITSTEYGVGSWNLNCNVTIDGCKIESNAFGLYQNGARTPATFTVRNSQITDRADAGTGIYIPGSPNKPLQALTVENCTVTGSTAIEVKHTNAAITNSTLIASNATLSAKMNGDGSCTTGYAFAVTSYSPKDGGFYPATGTVTVTGCKLYSAEGEPNGQVFVYKLKEGASVTIDGTPATITDRYDDEPTS